jgi:hypothetical protein
LRIDLRALPYHFLALERHDGTTPPSAETARSGRIIGRPRTGRHLARVCVCDADGLDERCFDKHRDAALFRSLTKHPETVRCLAP